MRKQATVLMAAAGLAAVGMMAAPATGAIHVFNLVMRGFEEFPGPGDADGIATGTMMIDDVANTVSWSWTFNNLDSVVTTANFVGHHIHGPAAPTGTSAGIYRGLSTAGSVTGAGMGTLAGSVSLTVAQRTAILANPCQFYVNIHTSAFGAGAVRAQVDALKGDVNIDQVVDTADLGSLIAAFGTTVGMMGYVPRADVNGDGIIDTADLGALISDFGETCP